MKTYEKFLEYYDEIVRGMNSSLEDEIDFLKYDVIENYLSETKNILELACGTGTVAKELIKSGFSYTGLDINQNMLAKAEKNLNSLNKGNTDGFKLILGDMTNFDLKKEFDLILCNYNSICHLLSWEDWQKFFKNSYNHLKKGGLLVFDINTIFEFENITRDFAQFYNFGENTVCLEMFKKGKVYEWLIKIFEKQDSGDYKLFEEVVREVSFPINAIKKELQKNNFEILEIIDYHYGQLTDQSERVYFICKKK
ncbi:hypothetical protein DLH72_01925 [Candidatus Gracilibacteria bacterium]|nr:MAG: hypothetical protein DLH72_01925 [Candidatus Gracilibacteria bacterium]